MDGEVTVLDAYPFTNIQKPQVVLLKLALIIFSKLYIALICKLEYNHSRDLYLYGF